MHSLQAKSFVPQAKAFVYFTIFAFDLAPHPKSILLYVITALLCIMKCTLVTKDKEIISRTLICIAPYAIDNFLFTIAYSEATAPTYICTVLKAAVYSYPQRLNFYQLVTVYVGQLTNNLAHQRSHRANKVQIRMLLKASYQFPTDLFYLGPETEAIKFTAIRR